MGCRFIFSKSDFDPSNSIGSRNLLVLTSTLIGLIAVILISRVHYGHNRNRLQSSGNRGFEGRKSSLGSTFFFIFIFVYVRQNSTSEFDIQISILSFYMEP